jgi:hypothetical protein
MTSAVNTKSGRASATGWFPNWRPIGTSSRGHEDELRAAAQRFADTLRAVDFDANIHTGLRDQRHVIFDNGQ